MSKPLFFTKMHGLGNDFIVLDNTAGKLSFSQNEIKQLCTRHTGIGADQLLLIEKSDKPECDFYYRIYNADGSLAEQCGNGARCVAKYVYTQGLSVKPSLTWQTKKGTMVTKRLTENTYEVEMGAPVFTPANIPFQMSERLSHYTLDIEGQSYLGGAVSFGNPHFVMKVDDIQQAPVVSVGAAINASTYFPQGVNVGFMQIVSPSHIKLRVYERGVGETKACGSGACAAVTIAVLQGDCQGPVTVDLLGGQLLIDCASDFASVKMVGEAAHVYQGQR